MLTLTFGLVQLRVPARTCGRDRQRTCGRDRQRTCGRDRQIFDMEAKTQNRSGNLDRCCSEQKLSYGGHKMATTNGAQFREKSSSDIWHAHSYVLPVFDHRLRHKNPTLLPYHAAYQFFFFACLENEVHYTYQRLPYASRSFPFRPQREDLCCADSDTTYC